MMTDREMSDTDGDAVLYMLCTFAERMNFRLLFDVTHKICHYLFWVGFWSIVITFIIPCQTKNISRGKDTLTQVHIGETYCREIYYLYISCDTCKATRDKKSQTRKHQQTRNYSTICYLSFSVLFFRKKRRNV